MDAGGATDRSSSNDGVAGDCHVRSGSGPRVNRSRACFRSLVSRSREHNSGRNGLLVSAPFSCPGLAAESCPQARNRHLDHAMALETDGSTPPMHQVSATVQFTHSPFAAVALGAIVVAAALTGCASGNDVQPSHAMFNL